MSEYPVSAEDELAQAVLEQLATADVPHALAELARLQRADDRAVAQLAEVALENAEANPTAARRWLEIGVALNQRLGDPATSRAQLSYAQARLYVQSGQLALAEIALRAAQHAWQSTEDQSGLTRSSLGLTQVLTLQGRYEEAEMAIVQAIFQLQRTVDDQPELTRQLASARHNLASLFIYQNKHVAALEEYERAQQLLEAIIAQAAAAAQPTQDLYHDLADTQFNRANALMFLDRIYEAEAILQTAIDTFDRLADKLNRGRARTNLGSLYLRTGRYAAALSQFDGATRDLLGDSGDVDTLEPEQAYNADVLLLDQASAYLALNLLPEAMTTLTRCVALFRKANRPYELGQALLTLGLTRLHSGDLQGSEAVLTEAERLFVGLQNAFWQNRTSVARALLAHRRRALPEAAARLDALLAEVAISEPAATIQWDIGLLVDAQLLRLRLYLENNQIELARQMATTTAATLGLPPVDLLTLPPTQPYLPHLLLRLHHALGQLETLTGNRVRAQQHLRIAIHLLESQRATLPVEEIRTAFLEDKANLYSELVLNLLTEPDSTAIAQAFAMAERARSRALLERLLATISVESPDADDPAFARRAELQQQLHLLYNRLLGEAGRRATQAEVSQSIREREAALQLLDWQNHYPLPEAQPVDLPALQAALPPDQQAVVYYIAGDEVLAFVVSHDAAHLFRQLCSVVDLVQAKAEWRFQLGRVEMDADHVNRHADRLERGWRAALGRLHTLLFAPLQERLVARRLLLIPYGLLHLLPLHALWDGQTFVLEQYECTYAPSASIAVHLITQAEQQTLYRSWAGLALTDPAIPAARAEIEGIARHFDQAWLYLDEGASQAGLRQAATQGDILHVATHSLFRPDNPFFSTLKLADGWVDVRTLYDLSLSARLVVLSACESGVGQVRSGDEVIGLARGFLALGAQSLLVSLWNVHDASSSLLMQRFYNHLLDGAPHRRPAAALRMAQLQGILSHKHPYYWAPFLVIGA